MRRPTRTKKRSALLLSRYSERPENDPLNISYDSILDVNILVRGGRKEIAVEALGPVPTQTLTKATNDPSDQD
jgi:hypothetical protein